MKERDVAEILKQHGWGCGKDDAGDFFCVMNLDDRRVQIIPSVGRRADHFRVSFMPSVSCARFSEVVGTIYGENKDYVPIIVSGGAPEKLESFGSVDVLRMADEVISWAKCQNINDGLAAYRRLPTDAKGAMPLRHLAALAMNGDIERLRFYKKNFEQGNRLGFVPYVTLTMIAKALEIAADSNSKDMDD